MGELECRLQLPNIDRKELDLLRSEFWTRRDIPNMYRSLLQFTVQIWTVSFSPKLGPERIRTLIENTKGTKKGKKKTSKKKTENNNKNSRKRSRGSENQLSARGSLEIMSASIWF